MKKLIFALTAMLVMISPSQAEEKYNHFPALESPDTATALCNIRNFNEKLNALTSKKTLTAEDMVKVHELTYTLENAVMRLQQDLDAIAVDLEKVHKASEQLDAATIKDSGEKYLTATGLILDPKSCQ
ncbi:DUF6746 family protein [Thalassotalea mangrovi]|uniref:Uncharacterized protein n=1 Tax=Thalassotalea mangrovi TaxID=2572245 RepID=A0A4U1B707_9GAMM|nr:DUF6746 family protein [Thalassotalea mangrovi]TKB46367.1 hypothetical protein E8M12_04755 [Thalassotalea mangrovi]